MWKAVIAPAHVENCIPACFVSRFVISIKQFRERRFGKASHVSSALPRVRMAFPLDVRFGKLPAFPSKHKNATGCQSRPLAGYYDDDHSVRAAEVLCLKPGGRGKHRLASNRSAAVLCQVCGAAS